MAASGPRALLHSVYQHVVLPRDVPAREDANLHEIEAEIIYRLEVAAKELILDAPEDDFAKLDAIRLMLTKCATLNANGMIDKTMLVEAFRQLQEGQALVLHVTEQNAALLIYPLSSDDGTRTVVFEAYETSATSEQVLASEGALLWDFPGQAIAVPYNTFLEDDFQKILSTFLEQSSLETVKQFAAVTTKASATLSEVRDTPHPTLISGALMAILEASSVPHDTTLLRKRVRDTVSFNDAHKPWRRSPFYLVLRVAIQRHLYNLFGPDEGRVYFKWIMCAFLSCLLDDAFDAIPGEASHILSQKLGSRLAKSELDSGKGSERASRLHRRIFHKLRPVMYRSLSKASQKLQKQWDDQIRRTSRVVRLIPQTARPTDLELRLLNSEPVLDRAFQLCRKVDHKQLPHQEELLGCYEKTSGGKPFIAAMNRYLSLYEHEEGFQKTAELVGASGSSSQSRCIQHANRIEAYVSAVGDAYDKYPELKSRQLLQLLEMWQSMDRRAIKCFPLLTKYHPGFHASMLDVLELSTLDEFRRLQTVQAYIEKRCQDCGDHEPKTIFDSASEDSYAILAYDNAPEVQQLRLVIEKHAETIRAKKQQEWERLSAEHEARRKELTKKDVKCVGFKTTVSKTKGSKQVHNSRCIYHEYLYLNKTASIETYEHPLPQDDAALKVVIFELMCPPAFAAYRDATWLILSTFAHPSPEKLTDNVPLLRNHGVLRKHANGTRSKVTLGSTAKSHLETHWKTSKFPTSFEDICYPFAMTAEYFDSAGEVWTSKDSKPSFAHLFPIALPEGSPYQSLQPSDNDWPTSNMILATQTQCPQDLTTHEFTAWQGLLLGTYTRWLNLLREMGSTNLNFSTDSTSAIVSRLCLQAGPATSTDTLRDVHSVFSDNVFCSKLLEQVENRLEVIRRNWREVVQLDILISILLKLSAMSSEARINRKAADLLTKARDTAQGWYKNQDTADSQPESGTPVYLIWAALLYKRTVYPLLTSDIGVPPRILADFIIVSIALQDCLIGELDAMPYNMRNAILRDLHLAWSLRYQFQALLVSDSQPLLEAVGAFWPVHAMSFHRVHLPPDIWWIAMTLSTEQAAQFHVHYNTLNGTLLIDGQQMGMLPPEYRRWRILDELLGPHSLRTLPSTLLGMSLVVSKPLPNDYWLHLAFQNDRLIIRAEQRGKQPFKVFELFDREIFRNDLPASLVTKCFHWLDLSTNVMEIRQQDPYKSKPANWRLDVKTKRATRNNGSTLVDPHCALARSVSDNFMYFEHPREITVYQPRRGNLRVELQRLELHFVAFGNGLLLCPQLEAVIAESQHQDVGTWHGLKSKLVLRSTKNPSQLSVLLPIGSHTTQRDGPHVSVVVDNQGQYLKFDVNALLGRIECPAEPVMLYYKAMWHALTAFYLPDSLTGCTGVEEALQLLSSGAYQPWAPFTQTSRDLLLHIAALSPSRAYYPPALKKMESVTWDSAMTTFMQDDRYRRIVNDILLRNSRLSEFSPPYSSINEPFSVAGHEHLENRALYRNPGSSSGKDSTYRQRDGCLGEPQRANIMDIASILYGQSTGRTCAVDLRSLLEKVPVIGGYVKDYDMIQITDILGTDHGLNWGPLITTALKDPHIDKFHMSFLFSLLTLSPNANLPLLQAMLSFRLIPELRSLQFPEPSSFSSFRMHEAPSIEGLMALMDEAKQPFTDFDGANPNQLSKLETKHALKATKSCRIFADSLLAHWPSKELYRVSLPDVDDSYFDRNAALELVLPEWNRLVDNHEFSEHIAEVQAILSRYPEVSRRKPEASAQSRPSSSRLYPTFTRDRQALSLQGILRIDMSAIPSLEVEHSVSGSNLTASSLSTGMQKLSLANSSIPTAVAELRDLVSPYEVAPSMVHRRYGAELNDSIRSLLQRLNQPESPPEPFNPTQLGRDLSAAKECCCNVVGKIRLALQRSDTRSTWLDMVGLWPKATILSLLRELRSTSGATFGTGVKQVLIELGLAITKYQRLLRIQDGGSNNRSQQMLDEITNTGHTNWSPHDHTDWLLLEIDSDVMLRPEQVSVALATISPESGQNSVVQLLMGKGKTSCILPMVALELASQNLFRIIVPRPLLLQSAQIMQTKLGGLLDREVIHVPFSRKTPISEGMIRAYDQLHCEIQNRSGVILALPEHILSFRLSGIQQLCDAKYNEAALMIKTQTRLDKDARDVLDECDITLGIRTQLIFPSGSQQTVDGHPLRWQTVQAVLDLVFSYLDDLTHRFPNSIEVVVRRGLPLVYFLREDVEEYLVEQMLLKICRGQTPILLVRHLQPSLQNDIHDFISKSIVDAKVTARVYSMFQEKRHLVDVLLHLRGLFVHRILLSTLKKGWNVQYGLHPARDPIAVPYQAKGVPSPTSEWGHPDVAIILTCLSFYYEGLNMAQFKRAFNQLAKSNEPSVEYGMWVAEGVPEAFMNYNGINAEDSHQLRELHEHVRYKVCLLDSYLNSFVFPQHAKQFSRKLSASGSDLVLYDPSGQKTAATTGFSGTNDTRHQLPMAIKQNDLHNLAHSNAEVLAYLLEDRNKRYVRMVDPYTRRRLSEKELLKKLLHPGTVQDPHSCIRILIDAGAQILEHDNLGLVKAWLDIDNQAKAGVFFGDNHRAMVYYRKGALMPLVATPFAKNLEDCVVYLDESHCRGTDMKLPPSARAALTLGPHLTKDALVQAAMRMRLLGKSQSVTFFSPPEVHRGILDVRAAAPGSPLGTLNSLDVIRWLLKRSCDAIDQLEPLYFNQSIEYLQRIQAGIDHPNFLADKVSRKAYLDIVRTEELRSLKQLYGPKYQQTGADIDSYTFALALRPYVREIMHRRADFQDRGIAIHSSTLEEVEQEREMEFELECVREVQLPVHFEALEVTELHRHIRRFAKSGTLHVGSNAFEPMFRALQKTALGLKHGTVTADGVPARLFVSTEFMRTVEVTQPNDNFLRPCHWLLWNPKDEIGMLVSPEEANALIPILRFSGGPACHLIVYAAPLTRHMLHFNSIDYYAIPRLPQDFKVPTWLKVELGIFAGRLYLEWDEHKIVMSYLGMKASKQDAAEFVPAQCTESFATKPLAFLHDWLAVRRTGLDFEHTPVGFITTGKPLSARHSFFAQPTKDENTNAQFHCSAPATQNVENISDDSDDEDDLNEFLFQHDGNDHDGNDDDHDEFHHAAEDFVVEDTTFFDGKAYEQAKDQDADKK